MFAGRSFRDVEQWPLEGELIENGARVEGWRRDDFL